LIVAKKDSPFRDFVNRFVKEKCTIEFVEKNVEVAMKIKGEKKYAVIVFGYPSRGFQDYPLIKEIRELSPLTKIIITSAKEEQRSHVIKEKYCDDAIPRLDLPHKIDELLIASSRN